MNVDDAKRVCGADDGAFLDYIDGTLTKEAAREFEAHVRECPACRDELGLLAEIHGLLKRSPDVFGPTDGELLTAMREVSAEEAPRLIPGALKERLRKERPTEQSARPPKEGPKTSGEATRWARVKGRSRLGFLWPNRGPFFAAGRFFGIPLLAAGTCAAALLLITLWPSVRHTAIDYPAAPPPPLPSASMEPIEKSAPKAAHEFPSPTGKISAGTRGIPSGPKEEKAAESPEGPRDTLRSQAPPNPAPPGGVRDATPQADAPNIAAPAPPAGTRYHISNNLNHFGKTRSFHRRIPPERELPDLRTPKHLIEAPSAKPPDAGDQAKGRPSLREERVAPRDEFPGEAHRDFTHERASAAGVSTSHGEIKIIALRIVDRRPIRKPSFGDDPSILDCGPYRFRAAQARNAPGNASSTLPRNKTPKSTKTDGEPKLSLTIEIAQTDQYVTLSAEFEDGSGARTLAQTHEAAPRDLERRARELVLSLLPACN